MFRRGRARTSEEQDVRDRLGECLRKLRSCIYAMPHAHRAAVYSDARLRRAMPPAKFKNLARAADALQKSVMQLSR